MRPCSRFSRIPITCRCRVWSSASCESIKRSGLSAAAAQTPNWYGLLAPPDWGTLPHGRSTAAAETDQFHDHSRRLDDESTDVFELLLHRAYAVRLHAHLLRSHAP